MNELQIFKNEKFGEIRVTIKNGAPWFVVIDACRILDLGNPRQALTRLDDDEKDDVILTDAIGREQKMNVVNEPGLYSLVLGSRKPEAKEFKRWLTHEVIPTIRKTGTYSINPAANLKQQEIEARLRNARVRESAQYLKIAAQINIPEYKYILQSKAAETLAGKPLLPMQEAERKTYSAGEIGNMFGVSGNKIGKIANANRLKTPEYGKLYYSKSEYSVKEVETWRYYENAIPVFAKLLGKEVA